MSDEQKLRPIVDWSAAIWAGIVAGVVFYILNIFLIPYIYGGSSWAIIKYLSSTVLGQNVLPPPASFDLTALITSFLSTIILSLIFTSILAYIIHRGGLITGIIGGAIFGLALYYINFNTLTVFSPWLYAMKNSANLINHIIFGILAGGLYETFEVEEYELVSE